MSTSSGNLLGVVLLIRHGDRQGFYQDPKTYTPSATAITPLGNKEEFILGQKLHSLYFNASSPSQIQGVSDTLVDPTQLRVRADAGGEGGVIVNSATSLLQGLFPANTGYNTTLANGTVVTGPLGGYQYIPIESVEPDEDISLEGWTSCNTFNDATNAFYTSPLFQEKKTEVASFLQSLPQYLDGRPVTLENMWNIFDFMNVQSIHNATFSQILPKGFLAMARDLAGFHEYGVFSSPQLDGIGNIAGRTIMPSLLDGFSDIVNSSSPVKFVYHAIAYKPFLSIFNMTGVAEMNPQLAGIVNYAAAVALEVRDSPSGPMLRFNFKNGTMDEGFTTYNFLGGNGDVPLSTFVNKLAPTAVNTTATWCSVCQNTQDRGCAALALAQAQGKSSAHDRISPVGAGFLGAGLTAFVALAMLAVLFFLGMVRVGRRRSGSSQSDTGSDAGMVERKA